MDHECDYADERNKKRYCAHKRQYCDGCGDVFPRLDEDEEDKLSVVERKDICKVSSRWGNYYIVLTAQNVADLIAGKCLALTGEEYNFFLSYEGGGKG